MNTRSELVDSMMPRRAGFRLARFEVLNWGTFHQRIWKIEPNGENALLTGDIGSGKSTLVDAITTLLVPPRKITYNRAAGAESKERSLYSYVRGEFRSVSNEVTGSAQAQALRDESSYSVILALFADAAAQRDVTLATVFWTREGERVPARFYVVAPAALSIAGHFTDFGTDIQNLRKRLRGEKGVKLHDSFEEYSAHMRREPFGRVPVLEHEGFMLYETQAILRYVDRVGLGKSLVPADVRAAARMDQIMSITGWYLLQGAGKVIGFQRIIGPRLLGLPTNEAAATAVMPKAHKAFHELSRLRGDQSCFVGEELTLADLIVASHVDLLRATPEWEALTAETPNLVTWLKRVNGGASFRETTWERLTQSV